MSKQKPTDASPEDSALPRREFLGAAAGAMLTTLAGCGDDGASQAGTTGDDTEGDTELPPESSSTGGDGSESSTGMSPDVPDDPVPGLPWDPAAIQESTEVFPRTPMAGEMKPTSFLIAGHVATGDDVTVRVWQPGEIEGEVYLAFEQAVTPDENGFFKQPVEALTGGEWYAYGLFAGDPDAGFSTRSLLGRVRTALPEGSLEPVRIAIAACIGRSGILPEYVEPDETQPAAPWESMLRAAEQEYDVFIHLGDQGYLDRIYDAGGSYAQYLTAWGVLHGGGYRDVYPRSGLYFTWDDHEVTNNGSVDPWTTDRTELERIANARQAYYTVMPIDADDPAAQPLWRSFRWGDTVEFIVLDCRSERQEPESGVYLGEAQFQFLLDRLRDSPCHFKCIVNSVPFSRLNLPSGGVGDILVNPEDRWEGYVTQRAELQAFVDENDLRNILWVTGDVHMCFVGQVDGSPTTPGESMWEVCVTSGNTNPLASDVPPGQFPWASQYPHVPVIEFNPETDSVHVDFVALDGTISESRDLQLG